jgi:hypothetical protein
MLDRRARVALNSDLVGRAVDEEMLRNVQFAPCGIKGARPAPERVLEVDGVLRGGDYQVGFFDPLAEGEHAIVGIYRVIEGRDFENEVGRHDAVIELLEATKRGA